MFLNLWFMLHGQAQKKTTNDNKTTIKIKANEGKEGTMNIPVQIFPILNFDSVVEKSSGLVDAEKIHGNWTYEHSFVIENGRGREFARTYKTGSEGDKQNQTVKIGTPNAKPTDPSSADFRKDMERIEREFASSLGRNEISQTELLMVFDPTFTYTYWQKDGPDQFLIQRKIGEYKTEFITSYFIGYTISKDIKTNKSYLEFTVPTEQLSKKWRIIYLSQDQLVLVDELYKELHYFVRKNS